MLNKSAYALFDVFSYLGPSAQKRRMVDGGGDNQDESTLDTPRLKMGPTAASTPGSGNAPRLSFRRVQDDEIDVHPDLSSNSFSAKVFF